MAERVGAFTPETARAIAEFVRGARRRAPRPRVDWHEVGVPQNRVIRWARTTTNYEYPTYPSSGGVYVVEMGDYEPDTLVPGDTPDKTFTAYSPAWTEIAVDPSGATIAEGTVVRVELHDGQWWIRPTAAAGATVDSYYFSSPHLDTAAHASSITPANDAYLYFGSGTGNASDAKITPKCNSSSQYGAPILEYTESGWWLFVLILRMTASYTGTMSTYSGTTGAASAGTAHTHPFAVDIGQWIQARVDYRERTSSIGAWSNVWTPGHTTKAFVTGHLANYTAGTDFAYVCLPMIRKATAGYQLSIKVTGQTSNDGASGDPYLDSPSSQLYVRYLGTSPTVATL